MLPTTEASTADGVIAFMNAAFGLRFAPDFFAFFFGAAFFGPAFLADFFAAGFLAGFLAFFEDFFAAFLAVAIVLLPGLIASYDCDEYEAGPISCHRPVRSIAPNIPQSRTRGEQI